MSNLDLFNFVLLLLVTFIDLGCGRLNADISVSIMNARLHRKVQHKFNLANTINRRALALGALSR